MTSARWFASRIVQMFVTFCLIVTFLFVLFRLMPGDITNLFLFQGASPEAVAAFEEKWGLNDPIHLQFIRYIENFLQLDMGQSLQVGTPVVEYTRMKLFNSFILIAPAITSAYVLGAGWGTILGSTENERLERYGISLAIFFGTIPSFFLGIMAVVVFSLTLGIFPSGGMLRPETISMYSGAPWWRPYLTADFAWHYILPFSVILLRYSYIPTMLMTTSVQEVLGQGFTFYHRITGLPKWRKLRRLGRHASLPVITMYPLSMTRAIGGLVLVEVVFNWPGIGYALVQAVLVGDFPVVQFIFLLVAAFIILSNFTIDVVYGVIDPRVRLE
jgi:peptide/nickel transport system permease protein